VKAYKPRENTIMGKQGKVAHNMLVVRQQACEGSFGRGYG